MGQNFIVTISESSPSLSHHGILGQKWGVRRFQNADGSLTTAGKRRYASGELMDDKDDRDSRVTQSVKSDYNRMSDKEFQQKYKVSKETYRKRVNKLGDPFANNAATKNALRITERELNKNAQKMSKLQKDIDSFNPIKDGLTDKNGRQILTKEDVQQSVSALQSQYSKYEQKVNDIVRTVSATSVVTLDPSTGKYKVEVAKGIMGSTPSVKNEIEKQQNRFSRPTLEEQRKRNNRYNF